MQLYKELQKLGIFGCVKDTVSKYGVFGLYKGLSALLTFSIPKTAVRFGTNESLKNHVFTVKFLIKVMNSFIIPNTIFSFF
jgi:solute carrier family 25 citrate transporter 1